MWTQLFYLNYRRAVIQGKRHLEKTKNSPQLNGRYRQLLAKEFRKVGLPPLWVQSNHDQNSKNFKPKWKKLRLNKKIDKQERVARLLEKADQDILNYRQEALNQRKKKGIAFLIQEILPDWLDSAKETEIIEKQIIKEEKKKSMIRDAKKQRGLYDIREQSDSEDEFE